ncbi:hypothetical protein CONLIGDRAFT_645998 [Coniochaeta ligniaria NRRL 30616]|uniref:Uncharacterized protein n=1 Tax=Coniochaeta ligniaria NRRL 30616 TaxID=1408157 RepID=A0A1J7JDH1_9PEZI|nr:hypothetical protein CONLIGDRAFT_645998 [Coniochaeta ligniaria NRRL 30616]
MPYARLSITAAITSRFGRPSPQFYSPSSPTSNHFPSLAHGASAASTPRSDIVLQATFVLHSGHYSKKRVFRDVAQTASNSSERKGVAPSCGMYEVQSEEKRAGF